MIQFVLPNNAGILDLYPNTRVKIRFNNPAFDSKLQTGSYILPFSLPATPNNMEKLYYINLATSRGQIQKKYECLLYIAGLYFASGILYVNSYSRDAQGAYSFSCDFSLDTGVFSNKLGDLKLPQLPHNTYTFNRDVPYRYCYREFYQIVPSEFDLSPNHNDMVMTLVLMDATYTTVISGFNSDIDTRYSETKNDAEVKRKAEWLRIFANKINKYNAESIANLVPVSAAHSAGYHFALEGEYATISTYYFAVKITYLKTSGGTPTIKYFPIQTTTTNILDVEFEQDDFVFPFIENKDFYDSDEPVSFLTFKFKNYVFEGTINNHIVRTFTPLSRSLRHNVLPGAYNTEEIIATLYGSSFNNIVPFAKIAYIFSKIAEYTEYTIEGAFLSNVDLQKLILYNNYALDALDTLGNGTNWYNSVVSLANHVPDTTVKNFMVELSKLFNYYHSFDFRKNKCTLIFRKDLLVASIVDISEKVLVESENPIVEPKKQVLQYNSGVLPEGFEDFFADYTFGDFDQQNEQNFDIGTLPYRYITIPSSGAGYKTLDAGIGNTDLVIFNMSKNPNYPIRLLFWRGERGFGSDKTYTPNYAGSNAESMDAYSLEWEGAKGLGKVWHEEWLDFLQNSQVTKRKVWFSIKDLFSIDLNKRYAINYQLYLIRSVEIEVTNGAETIKSPAIVEFAQFLK